MAAQGRSCRGAQAGAWAGGGERSRADGWGAGELGTGAAAFFCFVKKVSPLDLKPAVLTSLVTIELNSMHHRTGGDAVFNPTAIGCSVVVCVRGRPLLIS